MFSPQFGAIGQRSRSNQAGAVQQAASNLPAIMQQRESRSQYERSMAENKRQFDISKGIQEEQFNTSMGFQRDQQKQSEKRAEKAEKIGAFGLGIQAVQLGGELNDFDLSFGKDGGPKGGTVTAKDPSVPENQMDAKYADNPTQVGSSGGGLMDEWKSWSMGGFSGGMAGTMFAKAAGADKKWQTSLGGAVGGGAMTAAQGGGPTSIIAGAAIGGALGYLFG